MPTGDLLARGREAYLRLAWRDAYDDLSAADQHEELAADDLDKLARAAHLTGHIDVATEVWERANRAFLDRGDVAPAVRTAFWLGMTLALRGDHARGGGWLARAHSVLEDSGLECVERSYLRLPAALQAMGSGDAEAAHQSFVHITEQADRFGDDDLKALGRLGQGQALIAQGDAARGVTMLDQAMLAVTTGEVSPIAAGIIYCSMVLACRDIFDIRRVQEWTAVLNRWCARQQDLKPYRGQCLVHRSEIMQLRGEWAAAMSEIHDACEHLSVPPGDPVLGMAMYQQGELHRLRGEFARAQACYRQADDHGHPTQPGMALLRLAQGRHDDAIAAIRRTIAQASGPVERSKVLAAAVDIELAAGDADKAHAASDELAQIAEDFDSPYLQAMAGYARGAVLLAGGDPAAACLALRRSSTAWHEIGARYETARVRLLMARACGQLGDNDTAKMELTAAAEVFEQLGALPAIEQMRELADSSAPQTVGGLTARELDVLRLVATGVTNREIADTLVISDKTVARHLSNIFTKLGLSSRAAATAYAYEHELIRGADRP